MSGKKAYMKENKERKAKIIQAESKMEKVETATRVNETGMIKSFSPKATKVSKKSQARTYEPTSYLRKQKTSFKVMHTKEFYPMSYISNTDRTQSIYSINS